MMVFIIVNLQDIFLLMKGVNMNSFYDIAVFLLGDLPIGFTFLYSIFAFLLAVITVSVVFMFFKMCFHLLGVK